MYYLTGKDTNSQLGLLSIQQRSPEVVWQTRHQLLQVAAAVANSLSGQNAPQAASYLLRCGALERQALHIEGV